MSSLHYLKELGLIEAIGLNPTEINPFGDKIRITAEGMQLLREGKSGEKPFMGFDTNRPS